MGAASGPSDFNQQRVAEEKYTGQGQSSSGQPVGVTFQQTGYPPNSNVAPSFDGQAQQHRYAEGPPQATSMERQQPQPQYVHQAPAGLYAQPLPGIPMRPPFYPPKPGQVVVGYEYITPHNNPNACDLSVQGWLFVILLVIFIWPFAWIPCCMSECRAACQRPVFGSPGATAQHAGFPVAQPVYQSA